MSKTLADIIREKLDVGTLPHDKPDKLWAGMGSGRACTACERLILPSQAEYDLQYEERRAPIRLHAGCHGLWEAERRRRGDRDD